MKLIISDLDGTLIHNQHISKSTKDTVGILKKNNQLFTIATGRHMHTTREIVQMLDVELPVICNNGATIYDFKKEKLLYEVVINTNDVLDIMNLCVKRNLDYILYTTSGSFTTSQGKKKFIERIGFYPIKVLEPSLLRHIVYDGVIKILIIEDNQELLDHFKDIFSPYTELSIVQSQLSFLDISHKTATKGIALKRLSALLNIPLEDTIAFGDEENDISMIEVSGIGVAMGSGSPKLQEKADFITKSYEEDGFTFGISTLNVLNK